MSKAVIYDLPNSTITHLPNLIKWLSFSLFPEDCSEIMRLMMIILLTALLFNSKKDSPNLHIVFIPPIGICHLPSVHPSYS